MSEKLRLEAEFRDKGVSSGLKKIGGELALIKKTPGMTEATKWVGEFNDHANRFVRDGGGVKGVLTGIGIGGLTAATSIAELVKSFAELATRTADLKEVSRQTGLTVDQVNRLQRAGETLYIDPSRMSAGLESLSGKMFDFRRHMGELYGELSQFNPDFARKLSLEKPEEQIRDIFNWLSKIKDPQLQRRWTEAFMGDGDLARLLTNGGRDFANAMREAAEHTASITPDLQAKADLLHNAILGFNHEWQDFQTTVAPAVFEQLRFAMADLKDVFKDIKEVYDWFQKAKQDPAAAAKGVLDQADKAFNDKAQEVGARWHRRIERFKDAPDAAKSEDTNALHRGDVAPLDWIAKQKAMERARQPRNDDDRGLFGGLFHRSSFMEGEGGGFGMGGATDMIADGTKQGVLAAFREMMAQGDADRDARKGGIQNAAYTTYDDATPSRSNGYGTKGLGGDQPPARGLYDAIAQAEGTTKDGFNTTLSYGRWGTPSKPLTDMTLDEVKAFGLQQRRAQLEAGTAWNATSSANGKFQITGSTMMDAAKALGLDPSSTKFDGATQERMAAWIAKTQGLGAWEGFKGHPEQLAAARRALQTGDLRGPADGADAGSAARAADRAAGLNGLGRADAERAIGSKLTFGEWCADFVNGALRSSNLKGVNSSIANSFLAWGQEVSKDAAKKGDVLVQNRGRGVGQTGGHVGLYTGNTRMHNGRLQMEMVSGNYGDRVNAHDWTDADKVHVRRQMNLPEVARKSGTTDQTVRHEGGAAVDINLRSDGTVRSTQARSRGLITAVNLSRGPTMMLPSSQA